LRGPHRAQVHADAQPAHDGHLYGADRAVAHLRANWRVGADIAGGATHRARSVVWWRTGRRHADGRGTRTTAMEGLVWQPAFGGVAAGHPVVGGRLRPGHAAA